MADHLFLRLDADAEAVTMVAVNGEGQLLAGPEPVTLNEASGHAGDMQVTVLLPAREIVSCVARIPAASPARMRQLLPFTLEDEFAGDVDELHFAAGERNDADLLAVSVVARDRFETWLGELRAAGIHPRRIVSEADAVPDTPGTLTLFVEHDKITGRAPGGAPFQFSELTLPELWTLLAGERADDEHPDRVMLFIDPESLAERADEIDTWRRDLDDLEVRELRDGCLPRLAANLVHRSGANLLQGSFAPRSNLAALARPWRVAAGFLLASVALALVGKGATVWKLSADAAQLTREITAVCAQSYASAELNACRLEMLRRLDGAGQAASGGGPGYLATQASIADAAGDVLMMETMSYRDGVMSLVFIAPNVPYVEAFSQALAQTGRYQVRDLSTTQETEGFRTRLSVVARNP